MIKIGVLGVGDLTEKMVRGFTQHHENIRFFLSPRNLHKSQLLATSLNCQRMSSNQEVVDVADILLLGVKPSQLSELAKEITLRPNQKLISMVSGTPVFQLSELFGTKQCFRAMASYAAEINCSTIAMFPFSSEISDLLKPLGKLIALDNEKDFELATVSACINGWFYFLLHDLQHWLHEKGLPIEQAKELVLSNLEDCISYSKHNKSLSMLDLGQTIASPNTFTAKGLEMLNLHQTNAAWGAACEVVFDALQNRT